MPKFCTALKDHTPVCSTFGIPTSRHPLSFHIIESNPL